MTTQGDGTNESDGRENARSSFCLSRPSRKLKDEQLVTLTSFR